MIVKYANMQVLSAAVGSIPAPGEGMIRTASRWEPEYEAREGYLYVRSRAISSRTNDNFDTFPAAQIKAGYASFVGKPVFVNHHNSDPLRARGVNIAAHLHEHVTPDGKPDTWAEVLMEIDAMTFPMLSKAIITGRINRTSMGCSVKISQCSFCGNRAEDPTAFCKHVPAMKGQRITRRTASGRHQAVLVHEVCEGLFFFENSVLMEDPADPTAVAFVHEDRTALSTTASKTASRKAAPAAVKTSSDIKVEEYESAAAEGWNW